MWSRPILPREEAQPVAESLQLLLTTLIDLSLVAKQAHWNLFGDDFLATHEKLDEVVASARNFGDLVAERIVKLGFPADGRVDTVAARTPLPAMPDGFETVRTMLTETCDRLKIVIDATRECRAAVADLDPMTEDLTIEIAREIETHFWMLQAMEGRSPAEPNQGSAANGRTSHRETVTV